MQAIGFDNDKYLRMQSEKIRERIGQFGGKLYLEFGGKLFDDYHASRVLPGFAPDSKVRMLMEMRDEAEIIIAISADDIERNKRRGDLGITYSPLEPCTGEELALLEDTAQLMLKYPTVPCTECQYCMPDRKSVV